MSLSGRQDDEPRASPAGPPARPAGPGEIPEPIARLGRVHHVAMVVADLEAALRTYRDLLGLPLESRYDLSADGVRAAFLLAGPVRLEVISPTVADNGVARFLERRGEGLHHVCFEVTELATTLDRLVATGVELIDPRPRHGALGPVAFLHPRSTNGVLVELIEAPGGPAWPEFGQSAQAGEDV